MSDVRKGSRTVFLKNAWYVAAWDREVTRKPLARTLLDQPIVLYRKRDGTPVALEDRCCHRQLPLSLGMLVDDDLRCGYHGLRFNASGVCVEIPGQASIPPQARVIAYPIVEKWRWLWIWMGNPTLADPALIPNWWWCDHGEWACTRPDPLYVRCNYQLITDNVLDVTHLAYVHGNSIGNAAIAEFPVTTEREDRLVRMTRWILNRPAPPLYQRAGEFGGNVDRWQIVEHIPPCYSVNFAGCQDAGTGAPSGMRRGRRIDLMALSAPTPETSSTTHYFFAFVRAFKRDDPEMERVFAVDFLKVFGEDVTVLEAQQRMQERKPDIPRIDIRVDAAPLAARRMLGAMLEAEAAAERERSSVCT